MKRINRDWVVEKSKGKLGAYAMKRVAAGAHLPISWLFEPAKRPDNRADYCLDMVVRHAVYLDRIIRKHSLSVIL